MIQDHFLFNRTTWGDNVTLFFIISGALQVEFAIKSFIIAFLIVSEILNSLLSKPLGLFDSRIRTNFFEVNTVIIYSLIR